MGRWLVIVASAVVLLTALMPVFESKLWLASDGALYWAIAAIPAAAAITISVYAKMRVQLAAFGFLLIAVYTTVQLARLVGEWSAALYVATIFSSIAAVCALVNGLSVKPR